MRPGSSPPSAPRGEQLGLKELAAVAIRRWRLVLVAAIGLLLLGALAWKNLPRLEDPKVEPLVAKNFNSLTTENELKWERVHPEPDRYDFEAADRAVALAEKHGMSVVGHTFVWHNQVPDWVFAGEGGKPLDRETALKRLRTHIQTVGGRYKGRIKG